MLNAAAIAAKVDGLEGLKENVIVGHRIPAGTGVEEFVRPIVGSKEEYERISARNKDVIDDDERMIG